MRRRVWWVLCGMVLVGLSACASETGAPQVQATELSQDQAQAPTSAPEGSAGGAGGQATLQIQPADTEARFIIGEILGGQPNTVIGVNNQVQGQITLDLSNPAASQLGVIEIAADGFVTDSGLRNRAINQFILESGSYPVISFAPTSISGLPREAEVGMSATLEIGGDLTIRESTQPVTFVAEVTLVAQDRLEGSAKATIQRADFDLTIPQVPRVAGVDEAVVLEFDFVAAAP